MTDLEDGAFWRIPKLSELSYEDLGWSEPQLTAFRMRGDAPADRAVQSLHEELGKKLFQQMTALLPEVRRRALADCPACRNFLTETGSLPPWLDKFKVHRGQRLLGVYSPFMGIGLFTASLVGGSMFAAAAHTTNATG